MLQTPAFLNTAMTAEDTLVALDNGRDLDVDDLLQIDLEVMTITRVVSANNYEVARAAVAAAHAIGAVVYQLPAPYKHAQLNAAWLDPNGGGWRNVAGVWLMGDAV